MENPDLSQESDARQRVLIANRGEIARRAIRTIHEMGHESVAIYADPDEGATWVHEATIAARVGPADLEHSYLSIEAILSVAAETNSTAIFPGYGFLSEKPEFAQAVIDAGLVWVGPKPEVMAQLGDKAQARILAETAGLPVVPGHNEAQSVTELTAAAAEVGFPLLIKPRAGGGGRGIRRVDQASEFKAALDEAKQEAARSFGDDAVLLERYVHEPRHIEVQIVADRHGSVVHLGTRECSLQRRYQKVLEEAPAPNLSPQIIDGVCRQAVALASHVGYDSVGTVEFLVEEQTDSWYFLEMNTRLQVEHPVTEAVTGHDIVELMLDSAFGKPLSIESAADFDGHCFQARITAENPWDDFAPQTGQVVNAEIPADHRWDSAIEPGTVIGPHYDSLLGKLIVHGPSRQVARRRTSIALSEFAIGGIPTTTGFLHWLINQQEVKDAEASTQYIDVNLHQYVERFPEHRMVQAAIKHVVAAERQVVNGPDGAATSAWFGTGAFRLLPVPVSTPRTYRYRGELVEAEPEPDSSVEASSVRPLSNQWVSLVGATSVVVLDGHSITLEKVSRSDLWGQQADSAAGSGDHLVAPFPASVVDVSVVVGQQVQKDEVVAAVEAMKLLHSIAAPRSGTIQQVNVAVGDTVNANEILLTLEPQEEEES